MPDQANASRWRLRRASQGSPRGRLATLVRAAGLAALDVWLFAPLVWAIGAELPGPARGWVPFVWVFISVWAGALAGLLPWRRRVWVACVALVTGGVTAAALGATMPGAWIEGILAGAACARALRYAWGAEPSFPVYVIGVIVYFIAGVAFPLVPAWALDGASGYLPLAGAVAVAVLWFMGNGLGLQLASDTGQGREFAVTRSVVRRNRVYVSILFLLVLVLAAMRFLSQAFTAVVLGLVRAVLEIIRFLLSGLRSRPTAKPGKMGLPQGLAGHVKPPPAWEMVLEHILIVFALTLAAAVALYLLFRVGRRLVVWWRALWRRLMQDDASEGSETGYVDEREELGGVKGRRQKERKRRVKARPFVEPPWETIHGGAERARHLYRTVVRRGAQAGYAPRSEQTPRQVVEELAQREVLDGEAARQLARLYEEARYSAREVASERAEELRARMREDRKS